MTLTCDVLVIGAGPAGLSAALTLSRNGLSTIVIEKNKLPGPQKTSYDITEGSRIYKILNELRIKPLKISSVSEWISPNHSYVLDSKIKDFYFKRGPEKDSIENILLKKISKNNTRVFFETCIDSLDIEKKHITEVTLKTSHKKLTVKSKYIIGADGSESNLRKKLQINTNIYARFRGLGIIVKSKKPNEIPHARIYFNKRLAPGGYIYSGSIKNESFYCVVIDDIFLKGIKLRENLKIFLKQNQNCQLITKNYFSGIGNSGIFNNDIKNVLFIGGAALFHDPFLGYGLNYAIQSAYSSAQAIIKNKLQLYEEYVKITQQEIKEMNKIRQIWRKADNDFFNRLLSAFNGKSNRNDKQINKIMDLFNE